MALSFRCRKCRRFRSSWVGADLVSALTRNRRPCVGAELARPAASMNSGRGGYPGKTIAPGRRGIAQCSRLGVLQEHLPPLGRLAPALEDTAIDERPAVE